MTPSLMSSLVEKPFNHFVTGHFWHRHPPTRLMLLFSVPLRLNFALIRVRSRIRTHRAAGWVWGRQRVRWVAVLSCECGAELVGRV